MFGSLGFPELIFIFVLALLVFGPKKLPELGKTVGKAMGEFRRATSDLKSSFEVEMDREDREARAVSRNRPRPRPVDSPEPDPAPTAEPTTAAEPTTGDAPATATPSATPNAPRPTPRSFSTARGALAPPEPKTSKDP